MNRLYWAILRPYVLGGLGGGCVLGVWLIGWVEGWWTSW